MFRRGAAPANDTRATHRAGSGPVRATELGKGRGLWKLAPEEGVAGPGETAEGAASGDAPAVRERDAANGTFIQGDATDATAHGVASAFTPPVRG